MKANEIPMKSKDTSINELDLPGTKYWWSSSLNPYIIENKKAKTIQSMLLPLDNALAKKKHKRKNIPIWHITALYGNPPKPGAGSLVIDER